MEEKGIIKKDNVNDLYNKQGLCEIVTSITDELLLFNLETNIDFKLNDCVDEMFKFKDYEIKKYTKKLENPEVNENGEIVKEYDVKIVTILIDENNKSYVTASKTFGYAFMKALDLFDSDIFEKVFEIIKVPIKDSSNKALSFRLHNAD